MNKTVELLPCPFCGNDELTAEPETTYVMCHGCDADGPMTKPGGAITAWNTRAAPAEDVRAVVEEPVGYASETQLKRMAKGHTQTLILCAKSSDLIDPVALYRHPQRPVVLPERKTPDDYMNKKVNHIQAAEWNACLDADEELNK